MVSLLTLCPHSRSNYSETVPALREAAAIDIETAAEILRRTDSAGGRSHGCLGPSPPVQCLVSKCFAGPKFFPRRYLPGSTCRLFVTENTFGTLLALTLIKSLSDWEVTVPSSVTWPFITMM